VLAVRRERAKTSVCRTRNSPGTDCKGCRFRGGTVPYGYRIEKQGRFNKRNHEVYEIVVDEAEAAVVRLIFQKYVYEGYGAQRLSRYLYENGMLNRKGVNFANTTIVKMIKNITYVGILKSGETHSELFSPNCKSSRLTCWEEAEIMANRTQKHSDLLEFQRKSLHVGLVYSGHCGKQTGAHTSGGGMRYGKKTNSNPPILIATIKCAIRRTAMHVRYTVEKVDRMHGADGYGLVLGY
jgi:hypothetical protein